MSSISNQERQKQPFHHHKNIKFQAIPVSPSETTTPLQVVCFFDQTKNQKYAGGTEAVDAHFKGAIKHLRAEDLFRGEHFETLLLTPSQNEIPAQKLLLIGLGDPATLSSEVLKTLGGIIVREAIKLNVSEFCFAPSLKDASVTTVPTDDVAVSVATGMVQAIASMQTLVERKLVPAFPLKEIVFLAGAQHVASAQAGLKKAMELAH